ncbi:DUF4435 domain-containing protein [Pectobacterium carotovorum]|uniref:DUF4435 domain-containing protein n=1 Tax=Pectobacterium carotovorum TaxID=554 RepID=UPI001F0D8221|nr:DUF4435 domain-containing protein [Pectobacterium carotovorum]MCH4996040.1 DUF4435 domain-containing protein [Pectobacterium carotovorum]
MLERSISAKRAMPVFYQELNDINIFIEDTAIGYDRIYQNILVKLLDDFRIKKIFPIGSRKQVLSKAREDIEKLDTLFIVDGDLYLLGGEFEDIPDNVVVLERYCIENYLTDEKAISEIISEEITSFSENNDNDSFGFELLMQSLRTNLEELFVLFTVCHSLETGIKNVSYGYNSIIKNGDGDIDNEKLVFLKKQIYSQLSDKLSLPYLDYKIKEISGRIDRSICFAMKYVSAKDFTLPILFIKIRNSIPNKINNTSLKMRISKKLDASSMTIIKTKLLNRLNK